VHLTSDQPDRAWRDRLGVVTELFDEVEFEPSRTVLLLCGPEVMMRIAARTLRERGLPAERIFLSLERNMKCAVGLCGHCQLGPNFLCKEGPIFSLARIAPFFGVANL
jgi:NAD(P)H-flavin reductase